MLLGRMSNGLMRYVSDDMQRKILLERPHLISQMPEEMQNSTIEEDFSQLKHLDSSRQVGIIKERLYLLPHASEEVKNDRSAMLNLVKLNGSVIRDVSVKFAGDKAVVLAAVRKSAMYLEYGSLQVQKDILRENPLLLENLALLKLLVKRHPVLLNEVSCAMQKGIVQHTPELLSDLGEYSQKKIVKQIPKLFQHASMG